MTRADDDKARASLRLGLILGISAYGLWGVFPLYWPLLKPATPLEILSDRFLFSLVFMAVLLTVTRTWVRLRPVLVDRRAMLLLLGAAVLVGANWGVYIWAINSGNIIEGALGYFINPLVLVLMGTLLLGERLRRLQWIAVVVAALAVIVLTVSYGRLPWIALVLAFSFAGYGLLKKLAGVEPLASLTIETAYMSPLALGYLLWLQSQGSLVLGHGPGSTTLLLALTGVVTAIPLLLFGGAAIRVPLSTVGLLQYLTPSIQFILGLVILGEHMPLIRWIGFGIVWIALALFAYDSVHQGHVNRTARRTSDLDEVEAPV